MSAPRHDQIAAINWLQHDVQFGAGISGGHLLQEPQELLVAVPRVAGASRNTRQELKTCFIVPRLAP